MAHSPGIWVCSQFRHSEALIVACGRVVASVPISDDTDDREGPCNGLIIAAAPDLLATLRFAVARVEIANEQGDPILSAWLPDARAAIAKAEGRPE